MFDRLWIQYHALFRRLRRFERREMYELRQWLKHTSSLVHLSIVLFVPLLIGGVTWLSSTLEQLSFFLFPPLASGTYMLFSDPRGEHASPWKFITGLTVGALCGWVVLEFSAIVLFPSTAGEFHVAPETAALSVLLTAVVVWGLDVEEPSAFSTALLVLVIPADPLEYVIMVAISSTIVVVVFSAWRNLFYNQRAQYLHRSAKSKSHVLVPLRGEQAKATARFAARLSESHQDGRVILLNIAAQASTELLDDGSSTGVIQKTAANNQRMRTAHDIKQEVESDTNVLCEIVTVTKGKTESDTVLQAARELGCDAIVTPYEDGDEGPSPYVRDVFRGEVDTIAFRRGNDTTDWNRVLVPVRSAGAIAHTMLGLAWQFVGSTGRVSVCSCISRASERRTTERMLTTLVETVRCPCETHVARAGIEEYIAENAPHYDLLVIGASTDRSTASRWFSRPTFERIQEIDCDIAVIHRGTDSEQYPTLSK